MGRGIAGLVLIPLVVACAPSASPATPAAALDSPAAASSPASIAPSPSVARVSPSPSPSDTPVPIPALTETFRSPTMGYTVHYPAGWKVSEAKAPWRAGENDDWDQPNGDRIESTDAGFRGGSQPLAPGQTAQQWIDAYDAVPIQCGTRDKIPLGGSEALFTLNGCRGAGRLGGRVYDVVVVIGGRAYNFTMDGAVDHAFVLAMLDSIEFDPASADDRP